MLLQLLIVLLCIIVGARLSGIGLGVMGGLGVVVLTFCFGLKPGQIPVDVMLMIAAVISAAACMQAAGGLDLMVRVAERMLRKNPKNITIVAPLVTYTFTFLAGTGHVAYSVLPVIAEVARETKIRPERPLGIAVIASQQAITASPISAATVALLGLLTAAGFDISLFDILKISVPATLVGVLVGAFAEGLQDSFYVPISRGVKMHGVQIHANIIEAYLNDDFVSEMNNIVVALFECIYKDYLTLHLH